MPFLLTLARILVVELAKELAQVVVDKIAQAKKHIKGQE